LRGGYDAGCARTSRPARPRAQWCRPRWCIRRKRASSARWSELVPSRRSLRWSVTPTSRKPSRPLCSSDRRRGLPYRLPATGRLVSRADTDVELGVLVGASIPERDHRKRASIAIALGGWGAVPGRGGARVWSSKGS